MLRKFSGFVNYCQPSEAGLPARLYPDSRPVNKPNLGLFRSIHFVQSRRQLLRLLVGNIHYHIGVKNKDNDLAGLSIKFGMTLLQSIGDSIFENHRKCESKKNQNYPKKGLDSELIYYCTRREFSLSYLCRHRDAQPGPGELFANQPKQFRSYDYKISKMV